jgi:hypothetical protein
MVLGGMQAAKPEDRRSYESQRTERRVSTLRNIAEFSTP